MILKTLNISCVHRAHNLVTIIIAIIIIVLIYFSLLLFQVNVVRRPDQPLEFFDEAEDRLLLQLRFFYFCLVMGKAKVISRSQEVEPEVRICQANRRD